MKTVFWQLYCNGFNGFMHIEVKDEPETLEEYKAGKGGIRYLTIDEAATEGITLPDAIAAILDQTAIKLGEEKAHRLATAEALQAEQVRASDLETALTEKTNEHAALKAEFEAIEWVEVPATKKK